MLGGGCLAVFGGCGVADCLKESDKDPHKGEIPLVSPQFFASSIF